MRATQLAVRSPGGGSLVIHIFAFLGTILPPKVISSLEEMGWATEVNCMLLVVAN